MSHMPNDTESNVMIKAGSIHINNMAMEPMASASGASVAGTSSGGPPTSVEIDNMGHIIAINYPETVLSLVR